jgi:hypothetical protein
MSLTIQDLLLAMTEERKKTRADEGILSFFAKFILK